MLLVQFNSTTSQLLATVAFFFLLFLLVSLASTCLVMTPYLIYRFPVILGQLVPLITVRGYPVYGARTPNQVHACTSTSICYKCVVFYCTVIVIPFASSNSEFHFGKSSALDVSFVDPLSLPGHIKRVSRKVQTDHSVIVEIPPQTITVLTIRELLLAERFSIIDYLY